MRAANIKSLSQLRPSWSGISNLIVKYPYATMLRCYECDDDLDSMVEENEKNTKMI